MSCYQALIYYPDTQVNFIMASCQSQRGRTGERCGVLLQNVKVSAARGTCPTLRGSKAANYMDTSQTAQNNKKHKKEKRDQENSHTVGLLSIINDLQLGLCSAG